MKSPHPNKIVINVMVDYEIILIIKPFINSIAGYYNAENNMSLE